MNTPNVRPVEPGQSLADKHPELLAEWDYEANDLNPAQVTPGSGRIAHWVCSECGHRWASKIAHRTSGRGCLMCGRKKAAAARAKPKPGESLAEKHPELVAEWSHQLNDCGPEDVSAGSNTKAAWACKTCGHLWMSMIKSRAAGAGCPACATRVSLADSVTVQHPELVAEWSPSNDRAPSEIRPGSDYRARWICSDCGHEWQSRVSNRASGTGCPVCSRTSPSLGSEDPELVSRLVNPDDARARSRSSKGIQVWCDGATQNRPMHPRVEYVQKVSSFTRGNNGCPVCSHKPEQSQATETPPCESGSPHRSGMTTNEHHTHPARATDPTSEVNN